MSEKERPLPRPPVRAFGQKEFSEREGTPLMADRLAEALGEGRFEEFMRSEMPDNAYAEKLVAMMMGMTGMIPPENLHHDSPAEGKSTAPSPPDDLREAVDAGDVKKVMEILSREHDKRPASSGQEPESREQRAGQTADEKKMLDDLVKIAADNSVSLDWIIGRAVKLYISDYHKTGRL